MKKYLFETDETIYKRKRNLFIKRFLFLFVFFISFPLIHHAYTKQLIQSSKDKFFEKEPDAIVVFTGDKGRVTKALELSKKFPSTKVLISGVYYKNNLQRILRKTVEDAEGDFKHYSRIVELDFEAMNTYQNVEETLKFIDNNENLKNILIISSDYHLPRINLMINSLNENMKSSFFYQEISSNLDIDYLMHIFKEHLKICKFWIGL